MWKAPWSKGALWSNGYPRLKRFGMKLFSIDIHSYHSMNIFLPKASISNVSYPYLSLIGPFPQDKQTELDESMKSVEGGGNEMKNIQILPGLVTNH